MKLGLSLLLGEYVDAERLEHADTAGFQVVCPCCRESVFKVRRPLPDGRISHFLSHRNADPSKAVECEMRVAAILHEARVAFDAASRGQTVERFMVVLRQAVSLDMAPYAGTTIEKAHWRLAGSYAFRTLSRTMARTSSLWGDGKQIEGLLSLYEWLFIEGTGRRLATPLALEVQGEIAREVQRHLMTSHATANHDFLVRHAMVRTLGSAERYGNARPVGIARGTFDSREAQRRLHEIGREMSSLEEEIAALGGPPETRRMDAAAFAARHEANRERHQGRAREMAAAVKAVAPLFSIRGEGEGRRALERLVKEEHELALFLYAAQMEYLGTLLRLPYLRMAENHASGRPLLEGIRPALDEDLGATALPRAVTA